ncbi:hypothetical protein [Flavimarina sp. Hel_I_48]|uniref:hypothetical protein n=1 Tax=Flavimarina sp. Hel_I_48 TaxID=1392488 RepID=UPI0004DF999D|nr:hypothetical protein [Flavimarina sp. Hel_I_48]
MNLQARKYKFIQELFKVEELDVMDKLEEILENGLSVRRDTIEEYNKDLNDAISEIERGEFYTHDEAKKIASKW